MCTAKETTVTSKILWTLINSWEAGGDNNLQTHPIPLVDVQDRCEDTRAHEKEGGIIAGEIPTVACGTV